LAEISPIIFEEFANLEMISATRKIGEK